MDHFICVKPSLGWQVKIQEALSLKIIKLHNCIWGHAICKHGVWGGSPAIPMGSTSHLLSISHIYCQCIKNMWQGAPPGSTSLQSAKSRWACLMIRYKQTTQCEAGSLDMDYIVYGPSSTQLTIFTSEPTLFCALLDNQYQNVNTKVWNWHRMPCWNWKIVHTKYDWKKENV